MVDPFPTPTPTPQVIDRSTEKGKQRDRNNHIQMVTDKWLKKGKSHSDRDDSHDKLIVHSDDKRKVN